MGEEQKEVKGSIMTSLSNLEKILIVVAIILLISLVIILVKNANKNPNVPSLEEGVLNNSLKDDYCNNNIVIDKLTFRTLKIEIPEGPREYGDIVATWKDGSIIQTAPKWHINPTTMRCHIGDPADGENSAYFYCPDLYYTRTISNDIGEWLKTEEYIIDTVIDKNNYEIYHTHPPGWSAQVNLIISHDIIDYNCRKLSR